MPQGLDPRVVEVYRGVGQLLRRYTVGRLPKAFKIIPNLRNWEEVRWSFISRRSSHSVSCNSAAAAWQVGIRVPCSGEILAASNSELLPMCSDESTAVMTMSRSGRRSCI